MGASLRFRSALVAAVVGVVAVACGTGGIQTGGETAGDDDDDGSRPTPTPNTPPGEPIRFVALGDTGTASENQFLISMAIKAKCEADGCDFGLLLGDNFYDSGVTSADDPQFETKFQEPYGELGFPFYVALGNHDYGGDGAGYQFERGAFQVDYSLQHANYVLPAEYYAFDEGDALFVVPSTNLILWNHDDAVETQGDYFRVMLEGSVRPWKIAFAHHPYISNGKHGNAGNYDNAGGIPIANGANVKSFFEETLCGRVDLYLSGHDHSRQVLPGTSTCPGLFVVSGAGAKTTDLLGSNPSLFQKDTIGFTYVVVTEEKIQIEMLDQNGTVEFATELVHD